MAIAVENLTYNEQLDSHLQSSGLLSIRERQQLIYTVNETVRPNFPEKCTLICGATILVCALIMLTCGVLSALVHSLTKEGMEIWGGLVYLTTGIISLVSANVLNDDVRIGAVFVTMICWITAISCCVVSILVSTNRLKPAIEYCRGYDYLSDTAAATIPPLHPLSHYVVHWKTMTDLHRDLRVLYALMILVTTASVITAGVSFLQILLLSYWFYFSR